MVTRTRLADTPPFQTRDGSEIRELLHPDKSAVKNQSLAEAVVAPGQQTRLHRHQRSEEIYFVTRGQGRMRLGDESFELGEGEAVLIPPGTPHCIRNNGKETLHILCMCAPAYSHEDTELLD